MLKTARKKIAARLAAGLLVGGLALTGAQTIEVANAETADAYYWGNCTVVDAGYGYSIAGSGGYRFGKYCYKRGITFWEWAAGHRETQGAWVKFAHTRAGAW